MPPTGRPRSCRCGTCERCKRAAYMREWWGRWTPEEKRAKTARRDPDRVRESDRLKMQRRRQFGTPEQKQKIVARQEVQKALTRGDLVKLPCGECGSGDVVHAHHDDYSKPLDVRWLCRPCHDEWHRVAEAA